MKSRILCMKLIVSMILFFIQFAEHGFCDDESSFPNLYPYFTPRFPIIHIPITKDQLPPEVQILLGQETDLDCPCCLPHPHVTPQLTKDNEMVRAWIPARIANAERGNLIFVPADGTGPIDALIQSLDPPQYYSHLGIMSRNETEIRHALLSEEWLQQHKNNPAFGQPTEGFYERAVKFGWPGTITQTVESAHRSSVLSRNDLSAYTLTDPQNASVTVDLPDVHVQGPVWAPTYKELVMNHDGTSTVKTFPNTSNLVELVPFVIHSLHFDPVSAPILDSDYAQSMIFGDPQNALPPDRDANIRYKTMWPLVVKPCPTLNSPKVKAALDRIATAAESLSGHYRLNSYVDAFIAEDSTKFGDPADFGGYWETGLLTSPNDPCKEGITGGLTRGMACSTFIWEAVREANRVGGPHIWLTFPFFNLESPKNCQSFYSPPAGDIYEYDPNNDGLFSYPAKEVLRTTLWYASSLKRKIDDQASFLPWWLSPVESLFEFLTDIQDDVANQIGSAFTFDNCDPNTSNDIWLKAPPEGHSCSPDNIIRSWRQPTEVPVGIYGRNTMNDVFGVYGYNEKVIFQRGYFGDKYKMIWDISDGIGKVIGQVLYKDQPVHGAKVQVFCNTVFTDVEGMFFLDKAPAGRYLLTAGAYFPQPNDMPAWWLTAEKPVKIVHNERTWLRVYLQDPPAENRILLIKGHTDCVNRHVIGHDWWGHPDFICPLAYTSNNAIYANGNTTYWEYTIDGGWKVSVSAIAKHINQSTTNPLDPYPLEVAVTFRLESAGAAATFPDAVASRTVIVPTDGSAHIDADLKLEMVSPIRANISIDLYNYRQG